MMCTACFGAHEVCYIERNDHVTARVVQTRYLDALRFGHLPAISLSVPHLSCARVFCSSAFKPSLPFSSKRHSLSFAALQYTQHDPSREQRGTSR